MSDAAYYYFLEQQNILLLGPIIDSGAAIAMAMDSTSQQQQV